MLTHPTLDQMQALGLAGMAPPIGNWPNRTPLLQNTHTAERARKFGDNPTVLADHHAARQPDQE